MVAKAQPASSAANGGSFESGFASGALSSAISSAAGAALGSPSTALGKPLRDVGMVAVGGLTGGLGSVIGGGSFLDGVRQGIITSGLNHVLHQGVAGIMSGGGGNEPGKAYQDGADRYLTQKKALGGVSAGVAGAAKKIIPSDHLQRTQIGKFSLKTSHARFLAKNLPRLSMGAAVLGGALTIYNVATGAETNYYRAGFDIFASAASCFPPLGTIGAAAYWGTRSYIFPESGTGTGNGNFVPEGTKLPRFGNGGTLELEISPRGTRIIK